MSEATKLTRGKNELRILATQARARLKTGYWTEYKKEQELNRCEAQADGKDPAQVSAAVRHRYVREINASGNAVCNLEETFYKKVCEILDRDCDIINPVNQLVDRKKMEDLDESGKQRYIFTIMAKYSEMKRRYEEEKSRVYRS
jgi:hypothetical protein